MSQFDEVPAAAQAEPSVLPGARLREARAARGLSVTEVAQSLKFSARQIEALEADDYGALRGATFVRGFLRGYAKFLGLDPEPLLATLNAQPALTPAEVRPPDDTGAAMPEPGKHRLSPWIAGAAAMVLAAVGLAAWHFLSPQPAAEAVSPAPVATQPAAEQVVQPVARVEPAAAPAAPAAETPAAAVPPSGRQLVLDFSDKSWVEIKDAQQRIVLSGEFPGGGRQVVVGKPPFQLWIGRASAVRVHDGEREIDLKPHAREDVARLTIE